MKTSIILALLVFIPCSLTSPGGCAALDQSPARSWGQPAFGLRSSILVEEPSVAGKGPFAVSVILKNVSGSRIDLKAIPAFHLVNSRKSAPESTLKFGSYWCPVNLAEHTVGKPGPIVASPSRIVVEKGASLTVDLDLARHGWEKKISSWWPVRVFETVVRPGRYVLRLDIQAGEGANIKWIRSNEVKVSVGL